MNYCKCTPDTVLCYKCAHVSKTVFIRINAAAQVTFGLNISFQNNKFTSFCFTSRSVPTSQPNTLTISGILPLYSSPVWPAFYPITHFSKPSALSSLLEPFVIFLSHNLLLLQLEHLAKYFPRPTTFFPLKS